MRIMHLIHTPRYSGAEILVAALAGLHGQTGHISEVVAIAPAEKDFLPVIRSQIDLGVKWIYPEAPIKKISRILYFRENFKNFNPDVVFAHSVIPAAYGRIAGLKPIISVLHDASENDYSNIKLRCSEYFLQHRSCGVIAVSPRAAEIYHNKFNIPAVKCIQNGIDLDAYKKNNINAKLKIIRELNLPENVVIVLQVGRITEIKRQHLSVAALSNIFLSHPNVHFILAGLIESQDVLNRLNKAIELTGYKENIHILGPRKDIADLLHAADLYLMPSSKEAHSVAMIEALASGVQIVASNIPPFEYLSKYDGVALVDPNRIKIFSSMILDAISNVNRFDRNLEDFDIRVTAQKYLNFANDVCVRENAL